jgi:hypothetical protein
MIARQKFKQLHREHGVMDCQSDSSPVGDRRGDRPSAAAWVVISLAILVALVPLARAARFALSDSESDVLRQWITSQYVLAGVNPYPVALSALEAHYGRLAPYGPVRLRDVRISSIPKRGPHPQTDSRLGPPEATYPPTSAVLFAYTIGRIPSVWLLRLWTAFNFVLLALVAGELTALAAARISRPWAWGLIVPALLLWPPTSISIQRGQFSLLVLWSILVAHRLGPRRPFVAGLLYSLSLIKPSLALPFLVLPALERRWRTLFWTCLTQCALLIAASAKLHEWPGQLVGGWLHVSRYFRQGLYTIQEVINVLHLDSTPFDILIPVLVVAIAAWVARRYDNNRRLAFFPLVAVAWIYHNPHDFVVLTASIAWLAPGLVTADERDRWWLISVISLLILGLALPLGDTNFHVLFWRALRWGGRLALLGAIWGVTQTGRQRERQAQRAWPSLFAGVT